MDRFEAMRVFVAVIDAGSFVGASDALALSKAAVSRHVADLESHLGVRLIHRTTRKLSLTAEGEVFHARCEELLAGVEEAEAEITSVSGEATGILRINVPFTFGHLHLAPLWVEFMALHPKVTLDVTLADRVVDLVEEGFDMAVRIARLPNSTLISRQLTSTRLVLCASPSYLRNHGTPAHPSELAQHAVVAYSLFSMGDNWAFTGPRGMLSVKVSPRLRTNNGDTCRVAALRHQGIVLQPSFLVGPDLIAGTLVELLPAYRSIELGVYAVYPSRKFVAPKLRLLIDFLADAFRMQAWPG
ncbi:MAG: LysR family transcriptional regulator [Candidatus Accumulibacter meliphilus]|jgi:DNA-binding transcriptional LysR family regulator|uniref:LysR family transcriptional regulator n=1 Tax=Candidatus Accumulibacter meliphilus TaxID=2211374 RepID=A0A369XQJ4_9PROT|nr:MAG: LysR family transcriptional regulator [Candidatus Accumulibacter meliphilus]